MTKLKRAIKTTPGFDCMNVPCKHKKKGDHGIHCDEWIYSVTGKESALTLTCFTNVFPDTVEKTEYIKSRKVIDGYDLTLHVTFATEPSEKPFVLAHECDLLGKCDTARSNSIGAQDFVDKYARPERTQPESFWLALEKLYLEWDAEAQEKRKEAEAWVGCKHCDGLGRVRKE